MARMIPDFIDERTRSAAEHRQKIRDDLIAYCGLDTYGMIEIVRRLEQICKS
jgi:hypothetical protein